MKQLSSVESAIVSTGSERPAARLKQAIYKDARIHGIVTALYHVIRRRKAFNSKSYWEGRYAKGGSSGAGSYGRLAQYKAEILNSFVRTRSVSSVIEFGCGDGAQMALFDFKSYIGLDVSRTSIGMCIRQYDGD